MKKERDADWIEKGLKFQESGEHDEALKCFEQALKLNPRNMEAWFGKGVTLSELGSEDEALKWFKRVLNFDLEKLPLGLTSG